VLLLVALTGGLLAPAARGSRGVSEERLHTHPPPRSRNHRHYLLHPMSVVFNETRMILSDDAMFVHIPKTGGTAMEEKYKTLGRASAHRMIKDFKKRWELEHGARLRSQCVGAGQEFHFTPEEIIKCQTPEEVQQVYRNKEIFCLIREPVDRLLSEMRWQAFNCYENYDISPSCRIKDREMNAVLSREGQPEWHFDDAARHLSFEDSVTRFAAAASAFVKALPRAVYGMERRSPMSEAMLHLQPQYWYVFDEAGHQTCHKTIKYEDWDFDVRVRETAASKEAATNKHELPDHIRSKLKSIMWDAYEHDFLMYEELKALWSRRDELVAEPLRPSCQNPRR